VKRYVIVLAVMALAVGLLAAPAGAVPDGTIERATPTAAGHATIDFQVPDLDQVVDVFVQLDMTPVSGLVADALKNGKPFPTAAAQLAHARAIERQQDVFLKKVARFDVQADYRLEKAANGVRIFVKARYLLDIAALPGVKSIAKVAHQTPTNETSVPWIGAPSVWNDLGYRGEGVSIAVIDTGIDYYHANFGGSGDPADYEWDDPTVIESGTFPTAKVVGGWDFAGTLYNADCSAADQADGKCSTTPSPDPDPIDHYGHGSHVAGTAAGIGVSGEIGPGVAPDASLYAYKVFGDVEGSTSLTPLAIEQALDPNNTGDIANHVDVINMSLGSPLGDPNDPTALAAEGATEIGVIVVASAGNEGNVPYVTGSPAVAPGVISVAASVDNGVEIPAFQATVDDQDPVLYKDVEGDVGTARLYNGDVSGEVAIALDGVGEPTDACEPLTDESAAAVYGKIALVQRGVCSFQLKYNNVEAEGAIAIIVYNDAARGDDLITMAADPAYPPTPTIPGIFTGHTAGAAIAAAIDGGSAVAALLSNSLGIPAPELTDTLASFSSRGPGHGGTTFKPDLSAPGYLITSTAAGSGTHGVKFSGTSMASPHIAGAAALLRQEYPDTETDHYPAEFFKSLLMNSTTPAAENYPIARQGVGVAHVDGAATLGAYTTPAGVSFGRINPVTPTSVTRTITVTNMDDAAKTFDISATFAHPLDGVTIDVPDSIEVGAESSNTFDATLSVDPAAMTFFDDGFFSQAEADGRIVLTDGDTLTVGFLAAIDPASDVSAANEKTHGQDGVRLANPSSTVGWAAAFTYNAPESAVGDIAAVGSRTNNYGGSNVVEFGVALDHNWEAAASQEIDIYLDTNEDGAPDYILVSADLGLLQGASPDGRLVTALINLSTGSATLEWFVTADLNDQVQTMAVDRSGAYGFLDPGDKDFNFLAYTFDTRSGAPGGAYAGSVDLSKSTTGRDFGLLPGAEDISYPTPTSHDSLLWLFQNNPVGSQYQVVNLAPGNKGGNSGH
jgi:minor extracellular serine protease Vpr